MGLYFEEAGLTEKAAVAAVNEPRRLKVIAPEGLEPGHSCGLHLVTMSPAKHGSGLLKNTREVRPEFTLTAQ